MKEKGVEIVIEVMVKLVEEIDNGVKVIYEVKGEEKIIEVDYVLVIVGCCLNIDELGLEELGVKFVDCGLLEVDK